MTHCSLMHDVQLVQRFRYNSSLQKENTMFHRAEMEMLKQVMHRKLPPSIEIKHNSSKSSP
jgi:hypothetical protein